MRHFRCAANFLSLPRVVTTSKIQCQTCVKPVLTFDTRRLMITRSLYSTGRTLQGLETLILLAILSVFSPCQQAADSASLSGRVRDSHEKPVAGALVQLQSKDAESALNARTDSDGFYRFSSAPAGIYALRIVINGAVEREVSSLVLAPGQTKTLDCIADGSKTVDSADSSPAKFFDEPHFTVSGVTDTTNLGGHGSDTAMRTRESLAKDTASLAKSALTPPPAGSATIERSLREGASRQPGNFDANRRLGQFLAESGRVGEAIPYLKRAQESNPADYANSYDLARAYCENAEYDQAREIINPLMAAHDAPELHHLLGDLEEKLKDPLEALRQYQRAAEMDPSERNLFDWGSELLLHYAAEPALDVFVRGNRLFPHSERMLLGVGAAWFAQGNYEDAVQQICQASDLNPSDPAPYLFLGKMQRAETPPSEVAVEKLHRFAMLQPANPEANYYYAVALWKRQKQGLDSAGLSQVETLLNTAARLNPQYSFPHLQLGILHSDAGNYSAAISEYEKAIQIDSQMEEAHYRIAQAYRLLGQTDKSKEQLRLYQQLSQESAQKTDRQRHEIRQFVYTLRDQPQH
jgi:tetratricopeptide (TPR) repeat protein